MKSLVTAFTITMFAVVAVVLPALANAVAPDEFDVEVQVTTPLCESARIVITSRVGSDYFDFGGALKVFFDGIQGFFHSPIKGEVVESAFVLTSLAPGPHSVKAQLNYSPSVHDTDTVLYDVTACAPPPTPVPMPAPDAVPVTEILWLLTNGGQHCLIYSETHPSVESQNTLCWPDLFDNSWVAAHSPCAATVYSDGSWECDRFTPWRIR